MPRGTETTHGNRRTRSHVPFLGRSDIPAIRRYRPPRLTARELARRRVDAGFWSHPMPDARVPDARVPDARVPDARVPDGFNARMGPPCHRPRAGTPPTYRLQKSPPPKKPSSKKALLQKSPSQKSPSQKSPSQKSPSASNVQIPKKPSQKFPSQKIP